jgi:hypothetical protein
MGIVKEGRRLLFHYESDDLKEYVDKYVASVYLLAFSLCWAGEKVVFLSGECAGNTCFDECFFKARVFLGVSPYLAEHLIEEVTFVLDAHKFY